MLLIKRIDWYLFTELLGPFVAGMGGALVITSFGPLLRGIRLLTDGQVAPRVILEWFVYRVPEDMQYIFPVAILLCTLMTFGKLSRNSEITAMRAAGISLGRMLWPVAVFGLLVTVGVFFFLDRVVPPAMFRSQRIWEKDIRKDTDAKYKENILIRRRDGGLFYVGKLDLRTMELQRVVLRSYSALGGQHRDRLCLEISAQKGRWLRREDKQNAWLLEEVQFRSFTPEQDVRSSTAPSYELIVDEGKEDLLKDPDPEPREMSFQQLLREIRYLDERGLANTTPLKVELYLKTSFPFCILVFALLGATMGLTSHRAGGFIGFGIALIITFGYYVVMSLSSSFGKTGVIEPVLSAWLHNIIFLTLALANVVRVQSN